MRFAIAVLICGLGSAALGQEKKPDAPPRYGVTAELELYPQTSPKQAMITITKAIQRNRMDYLIAHLVDPAFIDAKFVQFYRVKFNRTPTDDREHPDREKRTKEAFEAMLKEIGTHMADDPKRSIYFDKLLKDGTIDAAGGTKATVTHREVPGMVLTLRQVDGRWYLANENEPEKAN